MSSFILSLQKNNYFLSLHFSIFHSKIHEHAECKMGRDEQGGSGAGRILEALSEHTFWMTPNQNTFAATKIFILIFNLTHFLISLMGSFHFPQWKISFPVLWIILKILGNGLSQSFMLSLKCDHPLLCEFPILF